MNVLEDYSDRELCEELLRRIHDRLDCSLYSTEDERMRDLLYDVGKRLIKRFPPSEIGKQ